MSIAFCCPRCGKRFEVDKQLAGKRARCKQCAHVMRIPGPTPAAPPAYAIADTPVEPLAPRGRSSCDDEPPIPPVPRKKKKKPVGFFASRPKKERSGGGGNTVAGFSIAGFIGVVLLVGRLAVTGGAMFGLSGRDECERLMKADIATFEELTAIFRTITDEPTARAAAPRAAEALDKMVTRYRSMKDKRARKQDIEEVKREYGGALQAAAQVWRVEAARVATIPGARQHLSALEGRVHDLIAVLPSDERQTDPIGMAPGIPRPGPRFGGGLSGPIPNPAGFPIPPLPPRQPGFGPRPTPL